MNFLEKYGLSKEEILKLERSYSKALLNNIFYKKIMFDLLLDYFQCHNFDLKTLLFNRLDLFLLIIKKLKIELVSMMRRNYLVVYKMIFR